MIGPTIEILSNVGSDVPLELQALFGERFAKLYSSIGLTEVIPSQFWSTLAILLLICAALRAFSIQIGWYLWEKVGELVSLAMRNRMIDVYLSLRMQKNVSDSESLSSVIVNDVRLTREYIVHFYGGMPREVVQILFYMATLYLLSPELFLIFFCGFLPVGVLLSRLGKRIRKRSKDMLVSYSSMVEWIQQRLLGVETIKHLRGTGNQSLSI